MLNLAVHSDHWALKGSTLPVTQEVSVCQQDLTSLISARPTFLTCDGNVTNTSTVLGDFLTNTLTSNSVNGLEHLL
jgi:hypothetical protein